MAYHKLALILGNCLFPDHSLLQPDKHTLFFMAEDAGLCTHFKYHKHKLILFLAAMRSHHDEISKDYPVKYWKLTNANQEMSYEGKLEETLQTYSQIDTLITYDIEDHFFDKRLRKFCKKMNLTLKVVDSPGFITTKQEFGTHLKEHKPYMHTFYQWQRKRLDILVDENKKPLHSKWSFDSENRKKLPENIQIPPQPESDPTEHTREVAKLIENLFAEHPGDTKNFNWATTRRAALYRLDDFLKNRFEKFGPYEDAIDQKRNWLFHSVLSPYLNMGLITPDEVVDKAVEYAEKNDIHYPSLEGFVRQIVGWREFMRGMYHTHDLAKNHFNHKRKMKKCWYEGTTGIPPLDDSIQKAVTHGYTHHIERLMILGNIMLLTGLHPDEVYRWFMEMYVDSSDWVMVPNVYGMSQFADGGTFATKPYIGGSNYILKMSNYSKGEWTDTVDGLYWQFIEHNRNLFKNNQRMRMMVSMLDKMNTDKKDKIFKAAT